jgi:hypothetical protein
MKLLIPFFAALLTGSLIFGGIYKREAWKDMLAVLVSFWLGMFACVLIVLVSILLTGHFESSHVVLLSLTFMILSCVWCFYRQGTPFLPYQQLAGQPWFKFILVMVMACFLMRILSIHWLYGDWDAWSLWNYRARYLVLGGTHWKDIFTYGMQGKHPWFLPCWIVFGWSWVGGQSYAFALFSAHVFTLLALGTVFVAILNLTTNENVSFLATVWLLSIFYFFTHSFSQYADVLTASLIVLNMILLFRLFDRKTGLDASVLGVMLGLMSFTKDEGILSALLIVILSISFFYKHKALFRPFLFGLGISLIPTIMVKYWMYPAPAGVNQVCFSHILEWKRWDDIIQYFFVMLAKPVFGGVLIIPFFVWASRHFNPLNEKDRVMAGFLTIFVAVFFILYLLVVDHLDWRLSRTGERLVYLIMPLGIVFLFSRLFPKALK